MFGRVSRLLGAGSILLAAVIITSCQAPPQTTTSPPASTAPLATTTTPTKTTTSAPSASPKYGGTVNSVYSMDIMGFDEVNQVHFNAITMKLTNEELLTGDWSRGPAGTGELPWTMAGNDRFDNLVGCLADSWQIVEPGHIVYKIRQGIRYGLNPGSEASRLVNGRELTATDIAFSLNRYCTEPTAYIKQSAPAMAASAKITTADKYTLDVRVVSDQTYAAAYFFGDFAISDVPKEVVQKYGDLKDWHNSVGTGPFFMTDYVSGSSVSFVRNPNYWGKDPVGPGKGNQLPYVDGVKILIIPDASTRLAALRAGKIDNLTNLGNDDSNSLKSTNPQLQVTGYPAESVKVVFMRTDKSGLPFKDKMVRQALMMATDFNTIKNQLYGGKADILSWPMANRPEFKNAYLPIDQLPDNIKQLYVYNPDKAKQLLADAGYPNGFATKILLDQVDTDYVSTLASMWAKVGVRLTLDPRESGVFNNIFRTRSYDEMEYGLDASCGTYIRLANIDGPNQQNGSYIDDQHIRDVGAQMVTAVLNGQQAKVDQLYRDFMPSVLEPAWVIPTPAQYQYAFWQPWLKNYYGVTSTGFNNMQQVWRYVWTDQNLKQSIAK